MVHILMHTSKTLYFALDQKRMNSILDTYSGEDFLSGVNDNTAKECSPQKTRKGEKHLGSMKSQTLTTTFYFTLRKLILHIM